MGARRRELGRHSLRGQPRGGAPRRGPPRPFRAPGADYITGGPHGPALKNYGLLSAVLLRAGRAADVDINIVYAPWRLHWVPGSV